MQNEDSENSISVSFQFFILFFLENYEFEQSFISYKFLVNLSKPTQSFNVKNVNASTEFNKISWTTKIDQCFMEPYWQQLLTEKELALNQENIGLNKYNPIFYWPK